jgi:hypothetical protein
MEIVDGRQTIAVNWIFGYIADERKYNDKVHQIIQRAILARVFGEMYEVCLNIIKVICITTYHYTLYSILLTLLVD